MAGPPGPTDYADIQENELQALESIFMEDFEAKMSKPGAWNKTSEKEFRLKIKPSESLAEDVTRDVFVTLHVALPATYPKSTPRIRTDFSPMISGKVKARVTKVLRDKPRELMGSEMMYELATSVQEILDDGMSAIMQSQETPALDEERATREAEAQRKAAEGRKLEDQRQRADDEEEQRMLLQMVERKRSQNAKLQARIDETVQGSEDQIIKTKDATGSVVAFRSVANKVKYRKGPITTVYTVKPIVLKESPQVGSETSPNTRDQLEPILDTEDETELTLVSKECTLKDADKHSVQALEARLETLLKMTAHTNVMPLLKYEVLRVPSSGWRIRILMPYVEGRSLRDLLRTITTVDLVNIRAWTIQMLEGLHFLHQNNIVMARMNIDNILLEISDTGKTIIKLSDVSYQHELHEIRSGSKKFSSAESSYWLAPETDRSQSKPLPSQDIWYLGVVLLQSLFGVDVQSKYSGPSSLINSTNLSISLEDLLMSLFRPDPKKRPSAFELLPNDFLRNEDPVLEEAPTNTSLELTPIPSSTGSKAGLSRAHSAAPNVSRYVNDFVESGRLGKGGFGEVVRARNKLDGTTYAIKKVTQSSRAELSGVLSEVMLLSRLNHPNIVRYYTAWVEEEGVAAGLKPRDDESSDGESSYSEDQTSTSQGLDFISSGGGDAGIEFGYDTDEDDEDSNAIEDEEASSEAHPRLQAQSPQQRRRSSASFSGRVTLYIQMEYCEKQTLRDLLRDLYSNVDECWRLFKQILSSLAYIHANGIMHRDLKPDNIFITLDETDKPRVRIGDFGLARPGGSSSKVSSIGTIGSDLTASIGTLLYVAPEVRSTGGGSYNAKADMFALGVILFEMSYPLKTAMERVQVLKDLRQLSYQFPIVFQEPEKQLQEDIIRSLVREKPGDRPSSQDLLQSGRIPSQVEDEAIQSALRSLSDKSSPFFIKLMDGLFSKVTSDHKAEDLTYDLDLSLLSQSPESLVLQSTLQDQLRSIFGRHGALEVPRQYLMPYSDLYNSSVRLLDASGTVVQLPYDLTFPYARSIAKQANVIRKTFSFGHVFRAAPAGVHPRAHGEFDFDIVTEDSLDLALREAEVLKVVDEIVDALPAFSSVPIVFHLTHSTLIDAILTSCAIPNQQVVKQIISKLSIEKWPKIRNGLRALDIGIASTSLDELIRFNFQEPYDLAIPKLRTLLGPESDGLESTYRHLEAVTAYMHRFGIKRKILVYPLGSVNERFYRGNILFQCILDGKRKKVLCAGGRYDALIQEYRTNPKVNRHAVGFNFGWDNVVEAMTQWTRPTGKVKQFLKRAEEESADSTWKPHRCDILIDSHDPALLRSVGISIAQDLWASGIKAELSIDSGIRESTAIQQSNHEEVSEHDWIILVKQDESLKVRSHTRNQDVELRRSELLGWLRGELRERDRNEGRAAAAASSKPASHMHDGGSSDSRDPTISVLAAQHRSKKANRRMVLDGALSRTAAMTATFRSAPIAAVELKDDLFEAMRDTRLSDPESWRRFVQSAPGSERQYLGQIHEMLLEHAREATTGAAWVYNFRSKNCFLYDLGTPRT